MKSYSETKMTRNSVLPLLMILSLYLAAVPTRASTDDGRKPYIVYMGEASPGSTTSAAEEEHHNLLLTAIGDETRAREAKIYSYGKSINGFVARLLPHEARRLSHAEGVISVFENTRRKLHTTRSWDFLRLRETTGKRIKNKQSNVIVAMLDTGIYIDAPSFRDKGLGPPPAKWKGKCVTGPNLTHCNNKVIGAKYFRLEHDDFGKNDQASAADYDGHGTHTASTVAGTPVRHASLYGIAKGTARGGVSSARLAVYKVCWSGGCSDMDLLAAFDEAIADGVDLISISIGGPSVKFFRDPISIGSFHAMKKGILTSCSGGNSGPDLYTVENVAPWILTAAASSIDRQFQTRVKLNDGQTVCGRSINTFSPKKKMYPLTSGFRAAKGQGAFGDGSFCDYGSLAPEKVKGRIVYCKGDNSGQDSNVRKLGAVGVVTELYKPTDVAFTPIIPGSFVLPKDGLKVERYINNTKYPQAVICKTRTFNMTAPAVASFSARGPQSITLNILKPDVSAPGVNILAAFSKLAPVAENAADTRHSVFNIFSGTSMACPHVTAAAAYVKSFHPDWSPAAIKSALMTTATKMKIKDKDAELAYGSGQINPKEAVNPGLVYDINLNLYIRFLCKEGYNSTTIALVVGGKKTHDCKSFKPAPGTDGLNYPSMHTQLKDREMQVSAVFHRTVTHVGHAKSVYKAKVKAPKGLYIKVVPDILKFSRARERQSFEVTVKGGGESMKNATGMLSASLEWTDSKHIVRSPIVIFKPAMTLL